MTTIPSTQPEERTPMPSPGVPPAHVACLVVHAQPETRLPANPINRRFWPFAQQEAASPDDELLEVEIHNLRGEQVFQCELAGPLIHVMLAPGTYHVTLRMRNQKRRYTMNLRGGTSFDLRIGLTRQRLSN